MSAGSVASLVLNLAGWTVVVTGMVALFRSGLSPRDGYNESESSRDSGSTSA